MKGLLQPPPHPWETAHLPLPSAYINTYLSLREKCWLKGGVGGQIPRIISWSARSWFSESLALMSFNCLPLGIYLSEKLHMVIVNVVYMQVFITFQGPTLKHGHILKLIACIRLWARQLLLSSAAGGISRRVLCIFLARRFRTTYPAADENPFL